MSETAKILGISYISVHRLVKCGLLKNSKALRKIIIPALEIKRFFAGNSLDGDYLPAGKIIWLDFIEFNFTHGNRDTIRTNRARIGFFGRRVLLTAIINNTSQTLHRKTQLPAGKYRRSIANHTY